MVKAAHILFYAISDRAGPDIALDPASAQRRAMIGLPSGGAASESEKGRSFCPRHAATAWQHQPAGAREDPQCHRFRRGPYQGHSSSTAPRDTVARAKHERHR